MDTNQPREISVVEPIGVAIEKTKQILFQPFDIAKWFIIGVSAWLATLGQRGGPNFQLPNQKLSFKEFQQTSDFDFQNEIQRGIQETKEVFLENLAISIIVGSIVLLLFLFLVFLITWVKSRTQFTYLYCIAKNKAEFMAPWRNYAKEGNSFFLFRLSLWFTNMIITFLITIPMFFLIGPILKGVHGPNFFLSIGIVAILILIMILVGVVFGVISKLTKDFVVPLMYIKRVPVLIAWKEFLQLLSNQIAIFCLYLLISICIFMVQMAFWMSLGLVTAFGVCCCFVPCCFTLWFYLPYFGVVLTLPWYVWKRSYSALFLSQFGPEFDVFVPDATPVVVPSAPIPSLPPEQDF